MRTRPLPQPVTTVPVDGVAGEGSDGFRTDERDGDITMPPIVHWEGHDLQHISRLTAPGAFFRMPHGFLLDVEIHEGGGAMTRKISLTVNGVRTSHEVEPRLLLVYYLRDVLGADGNPYRLRHQPMWSLHRDA